MFSDVTRCVQRRAIPGPVVIPRPARLGEAELAHPAAHCLGAEIRDGGRSDTLHQFGQAPPCRGGAGGHNVRILLKEPLGLHRTSSDACEGEARKVWVFVHDLTKVA